MPFAFSQNSHPFERSKPQASTRETTRAQNVANRGRSQHESTDSDAWTSYRDQADGAGPDDIS